MSSPFSAIVVAAGSGERLGANVPKALVRLGERPLVWHAVSAMVAAGATNCVVTIPAGYSGQFADALIDFPVTLTEGGATRQQSVSLATALLDPADDDIVLVHDAARALIPIAVIQRVADAVAGGAAAVVPGIEVSDSLRRVDGQASVAIDRHNIWHVQTPQGFPGAVLREAHAHAESRGIAVTDDASAAELIGARVIVVPGDREAMKVTDAFDLAIANELIKKRGR